MRKCLYKPIIIGQNDSIVNQSGKMSKISYYQQVKSKGPVEILYKAKFTVG